MTASKSADIAITLITLFVQAIVAWLYFSEWKKRIPPRLVPWVTALLSILWASCLFAAPFRFNRFNAHVSWIPLWFRGTFIAAGNLWGMVAIASFLIYLVVRFFASRQREVAHSPARRQLIQAAGAAAVSAPFVIAAFGAIVERTHFEVKEIDLPIPNLHPDLEGLRIGQLSDLHVSPWLSVKDLGRAVDMLNERKPHLTVVTGDVITQPGDPLDDAIRELGRIRADAGVLGCMGNHERYCKCEDYEEEQAARYGIDILRDRSRQLRFGNGILNVAGVDYQSIHDKHYLRDSGNMVVPGAANILLSHNPDVFPVAVDRGFDAMLAGHTHGGQVTIEILNQTLNFARFATPYVAGLYRLNGRSCYVTCGLGTIALPVRIGAPPEITIARLTRA
jgi:predicted MPP superfamily phosphohydrolase